MAPQMECIASPRLPLANIETTHAWLAERLREQQVDILVERVLGTSEPEGEAKADTKPERPRA